jgi:Lrp/AsnC family transcriptional regulator, regulator for asnA, asnC and gidA
MVQRNRITQTETSKRRLISTKKIDRVDAQILKDLLRDGRRNFADIAKECHVTKNTIWKHYKKLQRTGIITGSTVQLDYVAFGYHAIATILINVESTYREQVIEHLRKLPDVLFILQFNVVYNIRVIARLRNLSDLDHIKENIRRQSPVVDLKTFVWTDVKNNPYNLSIGTCQKTTQEPAEAKAEFPRLTAKDLDETDRRLIETLGADGRESFRKISKTLGVSTDTVVKRYEKLRNGV